MDSLKADINRKKARAIRYMKPMCKTYNLDDITASLEEMLEECEEIRWAIDGDGNDILPEMLGDDDEAAEFKNEFCSLGYDAEKLMTDIRENWLPDNFDDIAVSLVHEDDRILGYDTIEEDYFSLGGYENEEAVKAADARITRMTKVNIISSFRIVMHIILGYASILQRYTMLKAGFDIIREKNSLHVDTAKAIEELYEKMEAEQYHEKYKHEWERLVSTMPDTAWIQ